MHPDAASALCSICNGKPRSGYCTGTLNLRGTHGCGGFHGSVIAIDPVAQATAVKQAKCEGTCMVIATEKHDDHRLCVHCHSSCLLSFCRAALQVASAYPRLQEHVEVKRADRIAWWHE